MAEETKEILDLRRADLRGNVLANAYWITSAEINKDADQLAGLLFSFPIGVSNVNDLGAGLYQVLSAGEARNCFTLWEDEV